MAKFMEIKTMNPTLKQSEIAKDLVCSSSSSERYRNDKNMLSPYKNPIKTNKRKQKISNTEYKPKRAQMSSNDPIVSETVEPINSVKRKK